MRWYEVQHEIVFRNKHEKKKYLYLGTICEINVHALNLILQIFSKIKPQKLVKVQKMHLRNDMIFLI